jgi:hypothetical protein
MKEEEKMSTQFDDGELDQLLEHFADTTGDLPGMMESCYRDLMLIGGNIRRANEFDKDAFDLNMRLCIRYNSNVENYLRLKDLHDLSLEVSQPVKVDVDTTITNEIIINSN